MCDRGRSLFRPDPFPGTGGVASCGVYTTIYILYYITIIFLLNFYKNSYCSRGKSPQPTKCSGLPRMRFRREWKFIRESGGGGLQERNGNIIIL